MKEKIGYWKGEPISEMSREKLLETIKEMGGYYEGRRKELEEQSR
jgi:hypothetical protein